MPTSGVTNINSILRNVQKANNCKYPLFSLGFGNGVNFEFLKKLSLQNCGFARKIYEASDAALQLEGFYQEVSIPLLFDITINYETTSGNITQTSKTKFKTYFDGGEMMITGKVNAAGPVGIRCCFRGRSVSGYIQICPPGTWPPIFPPPRPAWVPETGLASYIERMWAYLTIQDLLEREASSYDSAERAKLRDRALKLSLQVLMLSNFIVCDKKENMSFLCIIEISFQNH